MKTFTFFTVCLFFFLNGKAQQAHSGTLQNAIDSLRFAEGDVSACTSVTWEIQAFGLDAVPMLIEKLNDTTSTKAFAPGRIPLRLTVGGIAFITLDRIIHLPYFDVLHMQFCVSSGEQTGYMDGFLSYICTNGDAVKQNVSKWYAANRSKLVRQTVPAAQQSQCMKDRGITFYYARKS